MQRRHPVSIFVPGKHSLCFSGTRYFLRLSASLLFSKSGPKQATDGLRKRYFSAVRMRIMSTTFSPASGLIPQSEQQPIAFVISGEDVFRVTADNIVQAIHGTDDAAFEGVAKLKAAAALVQLTNTYNERPSELRQMARELAAEGMRLLEQAVPGSRTAEAERPFLATA
jgi:hypothetical protein